MGYRGLVNHTKQRETLLGAIRMFGLSDVAEDPGTRSYLGDQAGSGISYSKIAQAAGIPRADARRIIDKSRKVPNYLHS